jgi:hypothetical protein
MFTMGVFVNVYNIHIDVKFHWHFNNHAGENWLKQGVTAGIYELHQLHFLFLTA